MQMWSPEPINDQLRRLHEFLQICRLQAGASVCPPYEQLSGIWKDGQVLPMNDEALFEQQLDLWRRN
jgi:hypothetical protein